MSFSNFPYKFIYSVEISQEDMDKADAIQDEDLELLFNEVFQTPAAIDKKLNTINEDKQNITTDKN